MKGHDVYNVPTISSNLILMYEIFRNFNVHTHLNVLSDQTSLYEIPDEQGNMFSEELGIPARAVWDVGIDYKFNRFNVEFNINNLLNKTYEQGGSSIAPIRQRGLWYMLTLSYKFNN